MNKAVLSNRIYLNRTSELHNMLEKNLTYQVPPKIFGQPPTIICDVTRVNSNILTIPIGCMNLIPKDFELVDKRFYKEEIFPEFGFTLREDQQEVYDYINDNHIIVANPSWGKTFMGISLACKFKQKTLIIVHTMALLKQWVREVQKTLRITPGIIGDGHFDTSKPITIATVQSLRTRLAKVNRLFGLVIVDECHHVPATVFKGIVDTFNARYKIGLTATPWRKDGLHVALFNYFGGDAQQYTTVDNNKVDPKIIIVESDIPFSDNFTIPWATRVNQLYENPRYLELITNLSQAQAERGHLVLTVGNRVKFLEQCHQILDNSMLVVGKTENRDFIASNKRILFGTDKIYSEGVNIPELSSLIISMPLNNRSLLKQLIGRVSRIHSSKLEPEVIDIKLTGKTAKNQFIQRLNFYNDEGLKVVQI